MIPIKRVNVNVYTLEQWQDIELVHKEVSKRTGRESLSATGIELFKDRAARLRDKQTGRAELSAVQKELAALRNDIEELKRGMGQLLDLLTCDNYPTFTSSEIEQHSGKK